MSTTGDIEIDELAPELQRPRDAGPLFSERFEPVGRGTLATELFEFLQERILQGDLPPGTRLVEQAIANETAVSRTPVRDALRQLQAAGLIDTDGRGLAVANISTEELRELWVVMGSLQGLATRLAAVHRSQMDLLELGRLVHALRTATDADDVPQLVEINRQFHAWVHRVSGNRFLGDVIQPMVLRIESLQDFTTARRRKQAQQEHEDIVNAIELQDAAAAEHAMLTHLQNQLTHAVLSRR